MTRTLIALLLVFSANCKTVGTRDSADIPTAKPISITLVGTNDRHGWIFPATTRQPDGLEVREGGISVFAAYLDILRNENPDGVLLLDGGDLFQGTLVSNLSEGEVVVDAYNALGYEAAAIGNHEFDFGPVGSESIPSRPEQDPLGALKARIRQARFPLTSTNIYERKTQARPDWLGNDGTTIVHKNGVRVGIVALTTESTPNTTNPENVRSLRFAPLAPETIRAAERLRAAGAEVIVVVAHAGGKCSSASDPHDLSKCDNGPDDEIFHLLKTIPRGTVDAVIAGHTHWLVGHFVNGTPVIETPGLGRSFGIIDLKIDPRTRRVIPERTQISAAIPICESVDEVSQTCDSRVLSSRTKVKLVPATFHGQVIRRKVALDSMFEPALHKVADLQHRRLGVAVPSALLRNRAGESSLGDVLADSLRSLEGADVALLNSGGIRADFASGDLTYGAVFETLPFDNNTATLTVAGKQLKELLKTAFGAKTGVFQISGLSIVLSKCPGVDRLKAVRMANGTEIEDSRRYKVVTSDFLARGGDGLQPVISKLPAENVDLGTSRTKNLRDSLVDYWTHRRGQLVAPTPGRITFVEREAECQSG